VSPTLCSGLIRRVGLSGVPGPPSGGRRLLPTEECPTIGTGAGKHCAVNREFRCMAGNAALHAVNPCRILSRMVQYCQARFDASFGALSDATRRGVLEQLGRADASITALAVKFHMTLTGMKKHVGVLEQAGLVTTEKIGRVRTCKLGLRGLQEEAAWIERHRQLWSVRFDELDNVVEELKRKEKVDGRKKRK
jgi:DNA-binding transcriptional ArsR family regulator